MSFLFSAAYLGRSLGVGSTWTLVFAVGISTAGTYLILAPLALSEKFRRLILFSKMKTKTILVTIIFAPILAGTLYWTSRAGSVEALPVFPLVIAIFYAWILLQAYFIATPVSQALARVETAITGTGYVKRIMRSLGTTFLFLPIAPLLLGVWEISSWSSQNYQGIQGAGDKIIGWTLIVTITLIATYFLMVLWGWRNIKEKRPQAAVFAGGTFLLLWGYLLYRATTLLMGYVAQNQPSNALIDTGLMIISIIGAMQTFARRTINQAARRWSQVLPFLVFSFGSVYAVAQFYFILQVSLTRADISVVVNSIVFATGVLMMMFLIRRHLSSPHAATSTFLPSAASSASHTEAPEGVSAESSADNTVGWGEKTENDAADKTAD